MKYPRFHSPGREGHKMSNWADQISEFQHTWLEQQQQLLSGWLGTLQNAAGAGTPQNAWRQTIDANEQQINSVLDAQQQLLTSLVKTVENAGNVPPESKQWEHQAEEGIELWTDLQHRLWKVWFDMLRNASPVPQTPGELLTQNWQDIVQRAVDFQEQCLSAWANNQPVDNKSSGKRSTKSSSPRQTSGATGNNGNKSAH